VPDDALGTKGAEVEEWVDLHFFRPLGMHVVRALLPTRVSADQVTLWALVVGLAGGHCFLYASPWVNALGFLLLVVSDVFDSADGQLARLRGTSTPFGRVLDGVSDTARFTGLYVHVLLRLALHGGWSWQGAALLAVAAGVSHSWQSAAVDCIRHAFLEFGNLIVSHGRDLNITRRRQLTVVVQLPAGGLQRVPFFEQVFQIRVFAHDLLGALAIIEQLRIGDLTLKLFEPLAFELNKRI